MVITRTTAAPGSRRLGRSLDALHFRNAGPRDLGRGVRAFAGQRHDVGIDLGDLAANERAVLGDDGNFCAGRNILDGFGARARGGQRKRHQRLRAIAAMLVFVMRLIGL